MQIYNTVICAASRLLPVAHGYADGDTVEICDYSEAHGDKGKVLWTQKDGLVIVEVEGGACWPVTKEGLKPLAAPLD